MNNTEETTPARADRKRSSYVSEFLDSERKKARNCLSDTQDDKHVEDLEYMLKSVRALIKIINEIWDKCKGRLTSSKRKKSPFTFEREVFDEVEVNKNDRKLKITTQKVSDKKGFGNLPSMPEGLSKLVYVDPPESENEILPDYNRYLDKCALLCDDVLLPFLTTFQEHLKEVQVYLGKIEEWLIEPEVIVSFLSELFDKNLDDVEVDDVEKLYRSYCLEDVDSSMESTFDMCTEKGREILKATINYMKVFKPVAQIEVKGAGMNAVNGTYTLSGAVDSVYRYSRPGVWNGKPTKFYLFRYPYKKRWWLACDDENQTSDYVVFYQTKATGEEYELPPLNGWRIRGDEDDIKGVDPPPQIVYKFDV